MILDTLANASRYTGLSAHFNAAFAYLMATAVHGTKTGKQIITPPDEVFSICSEYMTAPEETLSWEVHRRYADLHYMIGGSERIALSTPEDIQNPGVYYPEKDGQLAQSSVHEEFLLLLPGQFILLFPGEYHKTRCMANTPAVVQKIVVKVLVP